MRVDILKLVDLIPFYKLKEFYDNELRSYYEYDLKKMDYNIYKQSLKQSL